MRGYTNKAVFKLIYLLSNMKKILLFSNSRFSLACISQNSLLVVACDNKGDLT